MIYSRISIVIPTFNSEKTLPNTLDSIKKQTYPQEKIEVLIIDGGSTDKTLSIVKQYKYKIIKNPKTELIYAKHIGFSHASGNYIMYLDSDEVLENISSLQLKYLAFKKDIRIKAVLLSGYKTPLNSSVINNYSNEFGDPFSFFMYRESKGDKYFIKDWFRKYKRIIISDDSNSIVFNFSNIKRLPLIELWAGGSMLDLTYIRSTFPQLLNSPDLLAHTFYLLTAENKFLAITKNDNTIHYSSPNIHKYFKKLSSRIKNNIFETLMGKGGYMGRENFEPFLFRYKKYLFIPYAFLLVPSLVDSFYLLITRKKAIYLMHSILCLYSASLISYYYFIKFLGFKLEINTYGN